MTGGHPMRILSSLSLTLALGLPGAAQDTDSGRARTATAREGDAVPVTLAVADAAHNYLTRITFPDTVEKVVSAWNPKDLSVEHEGAMLFLKLLAPVRG